MHSAKQTVNHPGRSETRAAFVLSLAFVLGFSAAAPRAAAQESVAREAAATLAVYGSMPKGVTLEGTAIGFPAVDAASVQYDAARNRFTLNGGSLHYDCPIAREDLVTVVNALAGDQRMRMGVSIKTDKQFFPYGALDVRSRVAQDLAAADRILGGTVHGTADFLKGVRLPKNYQPKSVRRQRKIWSAARFNFTGFTFAAQPGTNVYRRADYQLVATLTPVIPNAARDGGHLPDREAARQGRLGEPEDMENFNFIQQNIFEFRQMPAMERAAKIGEAAAFVRTLGQSGVNLADLSRRL